MASNGMTALITGATSGIGYHLARLFAKDGYDLVLVARHQDVLDSTAAELQQEFDVRTYTFAKDLFDMENAFDLCSEVKEQGIQVDVLVNDAGQGQYGQFIKNKVTVAMSNILPDHTVADKVKSQQSPASEDKE